MMNATLTLFIILQHLTQKKVYCLKGLGVVYMQQWAFGDWHEDALEFETQNHFFYCLKKPLKQQSGCWA